MKRSLNAPVALASLLILVTLCLMVLSAYQWHELKNSQVIYVNIPISKVKINSDKDQIYPHQQEMKAVSVNHQAPYLVNIAPIQPEETDDLDISDYINRETVIESIASQQEEPAFLVIAGSYTDDLFVISKQAQLQYIGLPAEIIQFDDSHYKNLCVGRYAQKQEALALANILEEQHEISAYVYNKDKP